MNKDADMQTWWQSSHISGGNAPYVEALFEQYLEDPEAVPENWREFFESLPRINGETADISHQSVVQRFRDQARKGDRRVADGSELSAEALEHERKQVQVMELLAGYRHRGHTKADLDPLGLAVRRHSRTLSLGYHGLGEEDLDTRFRTGTTFFGFSDNTAPLRDILSAAEQTYAGTIGVETMHITDLEEKRWLQEQIESTRGAPEPSKEEHLDLLTELTAAEGLEQHLDTKYPGVKRFGLQGGESLIPMLDTLIQDAGAMGAKEIVMGMAHRGRLNVLVNIFGKNPSELFDEFEGRRILNNTGDVKYHLGFSSNVTTPGGEVHLAMAFNPSHLEIVSPVVVGSVRARQDRRGDPAGDQVVPISIHGDASFAGQGVVMETFQMSQTRAYRAGGTIHIVVNNQVGFTTSRQDDARSTEYCTEVAKMVQAPIYHVNADDPAAVYFVSKLAMRYRYKFKKDVVIDLVCYRRRGHNETDEPSTTQPLMYKQIKKQPSTRTQYAEYLVKKGLLSDADCEAMMSDYRNKLDSGEVVARAMVQEPNASLFVDWTPYLNHDWYIPTETGADIEYLKEVGRSIATIPEGFNAQRQVAKLYDERMQMANGELALNWGMAELLAYATLADSGTRVRMTGQDVRRGTFSHRHAVVHDQETGDGYMSLANISSSQRPIEIFDSLLSEEGVLAFEYGYSTTTPNALVIWEAQFGDFANGAQVVIDQFITSGEHKWQRLCGLTMLLPHGYEGQGAEHSSARLERFLQQCAEHNIQVCLPTTPAQIFHLLRRQAIRPMRRPLVVMSPKWILRHKLAVSSLEELANGTFRNAIGDDEIDPKKARKIVLCSGKVYYHLYEARQERGIDDVALIRIEQLYPFPEDELMAALEPFAGIDRVVWCQEEPMNQGAWYSSQHHMRRVLQQFKEGIYLEFAGRDASSAPAVGYMSKHLEEQNALIDEALS
jgi:2-oxoglutarate dehydrogenase E1 component